MQTTPDNREKGEDAIVEAPTPGLYKLDRSGALLYAPTSVTSAKYTLSASTKDTTSSIDGWRWFRTRAEAQAAYGIIPEDETYCARRDCPDRTPTTDEVHRDG